MGHQGLQTLIVSLDSEILDVNVVEIPWKCPGVLRSIQWTMIYIVSYISQHSFTIVFLNKS
jgi:hypothetical protein